MQTQTSAPVGASQSLKKAHPAAKEAIKVHPSANLFPMLDKDGLEKLAADIKENGQQFPVTFWKKTGELLDGRNRRAACEIVGLQPRVDFYVGNDPIGFIVSANIHRRHLTPRQKRELIEKLIVADPKKSDRQIAAQTKSSHTTVATRRAKVEARGDVAKLATRTDTKGREQPASKPPKIEHSALESRERPPTHVEFYALWQKMLADERHRLVDSIGPRSLLESIPESWRRSSSWRDALRRYLGGVNMRALEQERAEWRALQNFTAECRRLWPGAKITLQPDSNEIRAAARTPAGTPGNTEKE